MTIDKNSAFKRSTLFLFTMVAQLLLSTPTSARGQYLNFWQQNYPDSNADQAGCQLCHSSSSGGNGWNFYGSRIRNEAGSGVNLSQQQLLAILRIVEDDRSTDTGCSNPAATTGLTFLDEIRYNAQPGWRTGATNAIRAKNNICNDGIEPQFIGNAQTALDLPQAFTGDPAPSVATGSANIQLHAVATDFNAPVKVVTAPGINGSVFVVELRGKIIRVNLATGEKSVFADVSADLAPARTGYDEKGLLGLAFHPSFAANGLFYTFQSEALRPSNTPADYSTTNNPDHRSVVAEYRASIASCNSGISKVKNLIVVDQPQFNHNGGDLAFGPGGYLYISLGDGGSANDQGGGHGLTGNGRDTTNPLGAILRIDVNGNNASNGRYGIPGDNPFADVEGADEIYAYGLRNPYRMSFDASTGDLYTGDVGQGDLEEVNKIVLGGNYGWHWKEGSKFFFTTDGLGSFLSESGTAGVPNLIEPIAEYDHMDGISITGGYVYRGAEIAGLNGDYIFADYGTFAGPSGRIFYLESLVGPPLAVNVFAPRGEYFTGFGQDAEGELYVLGTQSFDPEASDGTLYKILGVGAAYSAPDASDETEVCQPIEEGDEMCFPIVASNNNVSVICL